MKLKQSKHEKELGVMKKEITRNRKEKRNRDIDKIRKYRDKKWDKIERRCKAMEFAIKKWTRSNKKNNRIQRKVEKRKQRKISSSTNISN
jgi:hypothetical protein